jgi:hypothetical protein
MDQNVQSFLEDAARRERSDLVTLLIRELLERWGHKRRGYWIVSRIQRDLEEAELVAEPSRPIEPTRFDRDEGSVRAMANDRHGH